MRPAIALAVAAAAILPTRRAAACGGFFCDSPPPLGPPGLVIEQASERILFQMDGTRVRTFVQIQYEGDPVDFAWVVPVPARPEIDVADPEIFNALETATAPEYVFPSAGAASMSAGCCCGFGPCGGGGERGGGSLGGSTVRVLSTQNVGPYSTAVVTADSTADLTTWLEANVYAIPEGAEDLIGGYVDDGYFFVAVRLQASASVDLIQPLVLSFEGDEPCVPLRLTSIAARPDMEVLLWIVGDAQAFPANYGRAEVDDDDVFAMGDAAVYDGLLSDAVVAAGRRAFVTEYAQPSSRVPDLSATSPEADAIVRSGAYLTRLRTRMDPADMTLDPIFAFDADLTDVSNVHVLGASPAAGVVARAPVAPFASALAPIAVTSVALLRRRRRPSASSDEPRARGVQTG